MHVLYLIAQLIVDVHCQLRLAALDSRAQQRRVGLQEMMYQLVICCQPQVTLQVWFPAETHLKRVTR